MTHRSLVSPILAALAAAAVATLVGCGDLCGNEWVAQQVSPDGRFKVVVFQRDCGATTGFTTQASLLEAADHVPGGSGNIFIADTDHGAAPAASWGGPDLQVEWLANDRVVLAHHPRARVFKALVRYSDVAVEYEVLD